MTKVGDRIKYSLTRSYQIGQISSSCDLWIITGELPAAPLAVCYQYIHIYIDNNATIYIL